MKNLEALRDRLKSINHPAHEVASFLLTHSNDPEYLSGVLRSLAEAVGADAAGEARTRESMFDALRAENDERLAKSVDRRGS